MITSTLARSFISYAVRFFWDTLHIHLSYVDYFVDYGQSCLKARHRGPDPCAYQDIISYLLAYETCPACYSPSCHQHVYSWYVTT